jgi:hypothetical protein
MTCKVNLKGLAPPDHPIYKEGWSISVGPGAVTVKPPKAPKPTPKKNSGRR